MEREEKSKKVAKEKRSVKKSKTVALPAKEIPPAPIAETPVAKKSIGTGIAKRPVRERNAMKTAMAACITMTPRAPAANRSVLPTG